ncbi:phage major capsid protein, P2 family, partial [Pseudomonas aeruginosa]
MGALSERAQAQYQQLQEDMAEAYNVHDTARTFAVEPTHAQELNDQITERADFLGRINVVPVSEIKGEKVLLGLNGPASSRTDTSTKDREPRDLLD